jgi:hypothetical protein
MGTGKILLIVFIALLVISVPVIFFVVIPRVKRKKLAQGIVEQTSKLGGKATYEEVRAGLDKVSNKEIDTLITWVNHLKNLDLAKAAAMFSQVDPIIQKAGLVQALLTP